MKNTLIMSLVSIATLTPVVPTPAGQQTTQACQRLATMVLSEAKVTLAQTIAPGTFTMPTIAGQAAPPANAFDDLPSFCRVGATLTPSPDSNIKIEVWLPTTGWNGKLLAVGNGGWAGTIAYAAVSTDTGHTGLNGDGSFALGHPEKITDFAHRAVHEMIVQAKAIVRAYYAAPPRWAYWTGCSTGGKQGLKEAQQFPDDLDGILAGAPTNNWTHLQAAAVSAFRATHKDEASFIPPAKYPVINQAVLAACDAHDGVKDGVLEDPRPCTFDPAVMTCPAGDAPTCLTAVQVEAARALYAPLKNPRTQVEIYPGLERGSEPGWTQYAGGQAPFSISADHFRFVVFKDPKWDYRTLDVDKDVALADGTDNGLINATDPNLRPFFARGGKLLLYHGWTDPLIAPRNTINYYEAVAASLGAVEDSMRLFMVPGMNHCQGGAGTASFDGLGALEAWVERKQAPSRIPASHVENGVATRTRPLCPYPQVAAYVGSGSPDAAESFICNGP
jgi:feruloyl esterase